MLEATFSKQSTVARDVLLVGHIVAAPALSPRASLHPTILLQPASSWRAPHPSSAVQ